MGGAVSIENSKLENLDYDTVKASGVEFHDAHTALQKNINSKHKRKGPKSNLADVSIHFLAIRQLSHNLKNQQSLDRTRKQLLVSRSLPGSVKYKKGDAVIEEVGEDYNYHANKTFSNFGAKAVDFEEEYEDHIPESPALKPAEVPKGKLSKKKKPNLFIHAASDASLLVNETNEAENHESIKKQQPTGFISPSANARVSPHGTLYMGKLKIKEDGLFPDEAISANFAMSESRLAQGSFNMAGSRQNSQSMLMLKKRIGQENASGLPTFGGKKEFIEICTLGSGASGVVSEALHLPSLTLVALKMLPCYNQEKRQHVSRELQVLYRNLADLSLVNDALVEDESLDDADERSPHNTNSACPNVLSLYNAFVDPKSGMINLVIEYMDGGSLEDLVRQGGCRDEQVIADIAYQTLKGLAFLHKHKSVHRDIKPANILCSSSGVIKVADFGISKALDKTSGFANSFVGTVCYMSPERITGENYSFPCDIWSVGLTLLAVAKGRFPLSGKETTDEETDSWGGNGPGHDRDDEFGEGEAGAAVIGGAAGYWAMIKAICDDEPPTAGSSFSRDFNNFIAYCLQKDPCDRLTAKELVVMPFILNNIDALRLSNSDKQKLWQESEEIHVPSEKLERVGFSSRCTEAKGEMSRFSSRSEDFSARDGPSSVASPLTTRLKNAQIKRASRDMPPVAAPSISRIESKSEDQVEVHWHEESQDEFDSSPSEKQSRDIITAIRLEHLDRVLERISKRLITLGRVAAGLESPDSYDDGDGDDTNDSDLTGIHSYEDDMTVSSSMASMDDLLQQHGTIGSPDVSPPAPGSLRLNKSGTGRSSLRSMTLSRIDDVNEEDLYDDGDAKETASQKVRAPMELEVQQQSLKDKVTIHSILKTTSSYTGHGSRSLVSTGSVGIAPEPGSLSLMQAEEKKAKFAAGRNKGNSYNSSNRSVHFHESDDNMHNSKHSLNNNNNNNNNKKGGLRARLKISLELDLDDDDKNSDEVAAEAVEAAMGVLPSLNEADPLPALPKTSSYFISSKSTSHDDDEFVNKVTLSRKPSLRHSASQIQAARDYQQMFPKLNPIGLRKWNVLAKQLRLPLYLVKSAVRSKFGAIIDLEEEVNN